MRRGQRPCAGAMVGSPWAHVAFDTRALCAVYMPSIFLGLRAHLTLVLHCDSRQVHMPSLRNADVPPGRNFAFSAAHRDRYVCESVLEGMGRGRGWGGSEVLESVTAYVLLCQCF